MNSSYPILSNIQDSKSDKGIYAEWHKLNVGTSTKDLQLSTI